MKHKVSIAVLISFYGIELSQVEVGMVLIEALLVLGRFLAPLMVLVSVPLSVSIVQELLALRGAQMKQLV